MKPKREAKKKPQKKTCKKPKQKMWKFYVDHLVRKNRGKPLKDLLKNYSKTDYKKFKRNPCVFF